VSKLRILILAFVILALGVVVVGVRSPKDRGVQPAAAVVETTTTSEATTTTTAAPTTTTPETTSTTVDVPPTTVYVAPPTTEAYIPPTTIWVEPEPVYEEPVVQQVDPGYGGGCVIPAWICERESGNSYTALNASSGAGGMYQFMRSTFDAIARQIAPEWVGTPPHTAPPWVQDMFAAYLWDGGAGCYHWSAC
jgi:hypothetical protein